MLNFIGVIILSYLFGSVPWSLVIGKVFFHKDIRTEGSGNLGGTNAGRVRQESWYHSDCLRCT